MEKISQTLYVILNYSNQIFVILFLFLLMIKSKRRFISLPLIGVVLIFLTPVFTIIFLHVPQAQWHNEIPPPLIYRIIDSILQISEQAGQLLLSITFIVLIIDLIKGSKLFKVK